MRILYASETSRNNSPLLSKAHGVPASTISKSGSRSRNNNSLLSFPLTSLYVTSTTSEPCHCTFRTVTGPDGIRPLTCAFCLSASSFAILGDFYPCLFMDSLSILQKSLLGDL